MNRLLERIRAHANNTAFHHTVFSLPFALMGALLAADGHPRPQDLGWIVLAITAARSAALVLDNLADLKYDKQQPRLAYRAMVQGRVSKVEALVFIGVCLLVLVFAVLQLHPICIYLLPVAAVPFLIYPFLKRVTGWVHLFLGIAIAMAPAGGWVAVSGAVAPSMVVLYLSVALWIGAFDAMYGAQDEEFDKSQGLHSLAVSYGVRGAFHIARAAHVLSIAGFIAVGMMCGLHWPSFVGVLIAAVTLVYQHRIVSPTDFSRVTQMYFMRNGIVSIAIFLFAWMSYYL